MFLKKKQNYQQHQAATLFGVVIGKEEHKCRRLKDTNGDDQMTDSGVVIHVSGIRKVAE